MDDEIKQDEPNKANDKFYQDGAIVITPAPAEIDRSKCVALVMGATCPNCGYERHAMNVEPHPVA